MTHATYIALAYGLTFIILAGVALQSWLAWVKIRKDAEKHDA